MKTNFLYFRENGYQQFTYSTGAQEFTINGNANWDPDIGDSEEALVKVTVTDISAGTDTVIAVGGRSISSSVITIAAASSSGFDLAAGDIVTIELIPAKGTEACLRADRLLSVHSNSDTETEITFESANGQAADDTVLLTHPDNNGAEFKLISQYINDVCNGRLGGGTVTIWDKQNEVVGQGLEDAGVTKMLLALA